MMTNRSSGYIRAARVRRLPGAAASLAASPPLLAEAIKLLSLVQAPMVRASCRLTLT
jgi:hypothetical protein